MARAFGPAELAAGADLQLLLAQAMRLVAAGNGAEKGEPAAGRELAQN